MNPNPAIVDRLPLGHEHQGRYLLCELPGCSRDRQSHYRVETIHCDTKAFEANERAEALVAEGKRRERRLRRAYGNDGYTAIAALVDRVYASRPKIPEANAWAWAESKYSRGEVLT